MSEGLILDSDDIKKILAEHFNVKIEDVIKTQYSFIIKKNSDNNQATER